MRHKLLADYLAAVEQAVSQMTRVYVEHYTEEILAPERAMSSPTLSVKHL